VLVGTPGGKWGKMTFLLKQKAIAWANL